MVSSKVSAILAFIGGVLILIAGTTGSLGIIGTVIEYIMENLDGSTADFLSIMLQVLNFIADLGGIAVILGGVFILYDRKRIGKFIIMIGAGMGLVGFVFTVTSALLHGWADVVNLFFVMAHSIGWIGIIFSLGAIILAK